MEEQPPCRTSTTYLFYGVLFTSLSADLLCVSSTPPEPIVLLLFLVTFLLLLFLFSFSSFLIALLLFLCHILALLLILSLFSLQYLLPSSPPSSFYYSCPDFLYSLISTRLRTGRFEVRILAGTIDFFSHNV